MGPITVASSGNNVSTALGSNITLNSNYPFTKLDTQNIVSFQTIQILFNNEPTQPTPGNTQVSTLLYSFPHGYNYIPSIWLGWQNTAATYPSTPGSGGTATTLYAFGDDTAWSNISTLGVTSATNLTAQSLSVSGIITATQLSTGASGTGVNITTDTISGPATLTIDPAAVGDNTGAVRIKGDLYVDGTQFIVNSTTIELADFNVGIASTVGTNALLDGAGIGIGSTGIRKTLTWSNSSTALKSSEDFDVASGKVYRVNGTSVLSNNTLGSGVVTSSLTSVGTLGQLQVTGVSTFTNGPILVGTATSTGTASQPLQVTGGAYVSGSVGIGTTNPTSKLTVTGDVLVSGVSTSLTSINTPFYTNPSTITSSYTVPINQNSFTAGPIGIDTGITISVSSGSYWKVI